MERITNRTPVFDNVLKVLRREAPPRPVLMELFMNDAVYRRFGDPLYLDGGGRLSKMLLMASAFANLGYDYFSVWPSGFGFPTRERDSRQTVSLNSDAAIWDRKSFDEYPWPEPEDFPMGHLAEALPLIPQGMRAVMIGPGGVLENIIGITGYDNLCVMLYEDPQLVGDIAENVGRRIVRYYKMAAEYDIIGAAFGNDDWGFNTQTMLAPKDMERYIFPWHRELVAAVHSRGKPCVLHSCGNPLEVMDNITEDIKYDGRHSYEDKIIAVEDFYERFFGRIAVIGGMDVDMMARAEPAEIKQRARKMLERTASRGGYALGTGNSVPEYIPVESYLAMLSAAFEFDG